MGLNLPTQKSCENFFQYLKHHPSVSANLAERSSTKVVFIADKKYAGLVNFLATTLNQVEKDAPVLRFESFSFDQLNRLELISVLDSSSVFVLFYESFGRDKIDPEGAEATHSIKDYLKTHWKRSVLLLDLKESFEEIYGTSPSEITQTNLKFIEAASKAQHLTIDDRSGGKLTIDLNGGKGWTNVDGFTTNDLIPGEVATRAKSVDGRIKFNGTFLGTIPFAIKYGMVRSEVYLEIKEGKVQGLISDIPGLARDFEAHFKHNEGNRQIDEIGVGTNPSVKLHAFNSAFEERHCGLHLGLGGATPGSHHLDLLFENVDLYLDGAKVFDAQSNAFLFQ